MSIVPTPGGSTSLSEHGRSAASATIDYAGSHRGLYSRGEGEDDGVELIEVGAILKVGLVLTVHGSPGSCCHTGVKCRRGESSRTKLGDDLNGGGDRVMPVSRRLCEEQDLGRASRILS